MPRSLPYRYNVANAHLKIIAPDQFSLTKFLVRDSCKRPPYPLSTVSRYNLGSTARGEPRVVCADNHHFANVADNFISLINLASVREIKRVIGRPLDPMRFRGNIYVDGWDAWRELDLVGAILSVNGKAMFKVSEPISRCAATNVDPATGERDMHVPRTLSDIFGHQYCGIYLTAIADGTISSNAGCTISSAAWTGSANRSLGI